MTAIAQKTKVVRLRITEAEYDFLRKVAAVEDGNVSAVIRLALRQFVNTRDKNGKPA